MAFASVGTIGSANSKTAGSTIGFSPSSSVPAGAFLVIWTAWDATGVGAPAEDLISVIDSQGNVWTSITGREGFGCGCYIHCCKITRALSTSDTITARYNTGASITAKAISGWRFSVDEAWTFYSKTTNITGAADPSSISLPLAVPSGITYLWLHALAAEGPSTDSYTWDSDYTQITTDGTTGGADDTNQTILGGFRIFAGTNDTVDVTSDTADRNYAQCLAVMGEFTPTITFPNTPLRDDFNISDEAPLSHSGLWQTSSLIPPAGTTQYLEVASNEARDRQTFTSICGQYLTEVFPLSDQEAWATLKAAGTAAGDGIAVVTNGDTSGGRQAWWQFDMRGGGASPDVIRLGGTGTLGGGGFVWSWLDQTVGYKIGIQLFGRECSLYVDQGSGWEWWAAYHYGDTLVTDSQVGLQIQDEQARADDFGGGDFEEFVPDIIRRPRD